ARARGAEDVFETDVGGIRAGARYCFVLDGEEDKDPFARALPGAPEGPGLAASVSHPWRHPALGAPCDLSIYELHVGAFTPEGTYRAASRRLGHVADLGVTAVELMPVAAF